MVLFLAGHKVTVQVTRILTETTVCSFQNFTTPSYNKNRLPWHTVKFSFSDTSALYYLTIPCLDSASAKLE